MRTWGRNHAGAEAWSAREWDLLAAFVRTGAGKGDDVEFGLLLHRRRRRIGEVDWRVYWVSWSVLLLPLLLPLLGGLLSCHLVMLDVILFVTKNKKQ